MERNINIFYSTANQVINDFNEKKHFNLKTQEVPHFLSGGMNC